MIYRTFIAASALLASSQTLAQDNAQSAEAAAEAAVDAAVADMEAAADMDRPTVTVQILTPGRDINRDEFPRDPQPDAGHWRSIGPVDYPPEAYLAEHEGMVQYALAINATGQVTSCTIRESSGHSVLDEATCKLMQKRANFEPALSENGQPVSGIYENDHNWRIRKPEFEPPFAFAVAFTVNENGEPTDCEIVREEGNIPDNMREGPCSRTRGRNEPGFRDEQGRPVSKRIVFSLEVTEAPLEATDD